MSSTISKYFMSKVNTTKRRQSSTSSDTCVSPTDTDRNNPNKKQERKKKKTDSRECDQDTEIGLDMEELKASFNCINEKLAFVSTKDDLQTLKDEIFRISETLARRMDLLESNMFDMQKERDKMSEDFRQVKKENVSLRAQLEVSRKERVDLKLAQNDIEQHGRLWNLRVNGVKEGERQGDETVADCIRKCVDIFTQKVGVTVDVQDIEIAHRSGKPTMGSSGNRARPRPILIRFFSRQKKTEVLKNRRNLKKTGVSISEDLTVSNLRLLKQVADHSATTSAWSSNGKIIAKLKNGATMRLTIGTDLNDQLRTTMSQ